MSRPTTFKRGDLVILLSVPVWDGDATDVLHIGEAHPIDHVRNYPEPRGTWYDVAGWVVQERNIQLAPTEGAGT